MNTKDFLTSLRSRNLIAQISHEEELKEILSLGQSSQGKPLSLYAGFDPTAPSLHVGNLAVLMLLRRGQQCGLTPIVLFGGATGLIGDPTGRTEMRQLKTKEEIQGYIENFKSLSLRYFKNDVFNAPIFVNNIDWASQMSWIDFTRNVGAHFTVARLLAAEVNKTRFQEGGLTFMELGYQLLQSYDFLHLYKSYNCMIQVGGDDQWSNILSGADLIRRLGCGKAFAITTPLLIAADGKKFGKTANNAVWLDAKMTSPYEFYQFFRNIDDRDIETLFFVFTERSLEEIKELKSQLTVNELKERLALDVTELVHSESEAIQAHETSKALFQQNTFINIDAMPSTILSQKEITQGVDILLLLVKCKLAQSRSDARKLIQGGGVSLNRDKVTNANLKITRDLFQESGQEEIILLRKGKKEYHAVKLFTSTC